MNTNCRSIALQAAIDIKNYTFEYRTGNDNMDAAANLNEFHNTILKDDSVNEIATIGFLNEINAEFGQLQ